jgi:hypothetical protein
MTDSLIADRWIEDKLKSDATLTGLVGERIYMDEAEELSTPFIVWSLVSDIPVQVVNHKTILYTAVYQVKAVSVGPGYASGAAIMARVNTLLHDQSGAAPGGGYVEECVQGERFRYAETTDRIHYRHIGNNFRITTRE